MTTVDCERAMTSKNYALGATHAQISSLLGNEALYQIATENEVAALYQDCDYQLGWVDGMRRANGKKLAQQAALEAEKKAQEAKQQAQAQLESRILGAIYKQMESYGFGNGLCSTQSEESRYIRCLPAAIAKAVASCSSPS